jgi:hypothetical protein
LNCLPESAVSKKSEFLNIFISSPPCLLQLLLRIHILHSCLLKWALLQKCQNANINKLPLRCKLLCMHVHICIN